MNHAANPPQTDHEQDEYAWLLEQAAAIRGKRYNNVDGDNVSEYLTDIAARDRRELRSRLIVLTTHIIKCRLCPDRITRSWVLTIREQQDEITQILKFSPSLRAFADQEATAIRQLAFDGATIETGTSPTARKPPLTEITATLEELLTTSFVPTLHPSAPVVTGKFNRRRTN